MSRMKLFTLALTSTLITTACSGSSGGGGGGTNTNQDQQAVEALRHELFAAGVEALPAPPVVTDELVALGQALFFDKIMSGNEDTSCATCHLPQFGMSDGRTLSDGVGGLGFGPERGGGKIIPRNSPTILGLHLKHEFFWDGRVELNQGSLTMPAAVNLTEKFRSTFSPGLEGLAAQAMLPPVSREEMRGEPGENPAGDVGNGYGNSGGNSESTEQVWGILTERLLDIPGYVEMLQAAYPGVALQDINFGHVGNAIAAFETRAFARTDSSFERFVRGDDSALTKEQVMGALEFFGPAGCAACHSGSLFTDQDHHNTGLPQLGPGTSPCLTCVGALFDHSDIGRENATGRLEDRYKFRTPTLLNVELTGPYGHAGQFAELRDFVAHYRDPELSNRQYDIQSNVFDPALVTTLVPNSDLVLATLDQKLQSPKVFDVDAVTEFLRSLTAHDAGDLSDVVPASVPSGLPVF
jgi:cytochrome c peroxidase